MRLVFTSERLENVEGVAKALEEAGIATKISDGRSWRGNSRREFSYREKARNPNPPAVWVLKAEDYKRAREILHDAGLLAQTRAETFIADLPALREEQAPRDARGGLVLRAKLVILAGIVGLGVLVLMKTFGD
jgi:hypothetical protein